MLFASLPISILRAFCITHLPLAYKENLSIRGLLHEEGRRFSGFDYDRIELTKSSPGS